MYLWKIVAKSEKRDMKRCKMGVVVDGRTSLGDGNDSMANYFGNVISVPFEEERVEELVPKPLSWVSNAIHEYVHVATRKEHFLGFIDWVESHQPEPLVAKFCCNGSEDETSFAVSSGQQFPVGKVDFGWVRPVFGSYHSLPGGESGYVMPMPMVIEVLEGEAGDVFQPLTPEYLGLHGDTIKF